MMQWILCISGDQQTARQLRHILQKLRFRTETARGFAEAMDQLDHRSSPALTIVDFQLTDCSGLEMIRRLRRERRTMRAPILMLATAIQVEHYRAKPVKPGPQEWVEKPVDDDRLAAVVTRWVGVDVKPPAVFQEPGHDHVRTLPDEGAFSNLPAARVIRLAGQRGSGRLRVEMNEQWLDIWIENKKIIGVASSYIPGNSLGEMLVREDQLSRHVLAEAEKALAKNHRLGEWLIKQGMFTFVELQDQLEQHVMEKLTSVFAWRWYNGRWRFFPDEKPDRAQVLCEVNPREAVFAGIARHYDLDRLEMIFSKRERLRRALIPTTPYTEGLPVVARRLLRAADGRSSLVRIRLRSGMEVRRFYQTLYALWVLELVRFGDPAQSENLQQLLNEEMFLNADENIDHHRR